MAKRKEDLVLVYGLNNSPSIWDGVCATLEQLMPESLTIHRPTLPPLDSTEAISSALLDQLPDTFSYVGFSFGGFVGLAMLEAAPTRFERFALACSSTRAEAEEFKPVRRKAMDIAANGDHAAMMAKALPNTIHPDRLTDEELLRKRERMVAEYGPARFVAHGQACLDRPDRTAVLRAYRGPKLLVAADADRVVPAEVVRGVAADVPDAGFVTISHCGHLLPLERPDALAQTLASWLQAPHPVKDGTAN